jgi:hypothetical protein
LKKSEKKKMKTAKKEIPYVVAYTGDGSLLELVPDMGGLTSKNFQSGSKFVLELVNR